MDHQGSPLPCCLCPWEPTGWEAWSQSDAWRRRKGPCCRRGVISESRHPPRLLASSLLHGDVAYRSSQLCLGRFPVSFRAAMSWGFESCWVRWAGLLEIKWCNCPYLQLFSRFSAQQLRSQRFWQFVIEPLWWDRLHLRTTKKWFYLVGNVFILFFLLCLFAHLSAWYHIHMLQPRVSDPGPAGETWIPV